MLHKSISSLFSHLTVTSSRVARFCSPPTNLLIMHSFTTCIAAPQSHCEDWTKPNFCIVAASLAVPASSPLRLVQDLHPRLQIGECKLGLPKFISMPIPELLPLCEDIAVGLDMLLFIWDWQWLAALNMSAWMAAAKGCCKISCGKSAGTAGVGVFFWRWAE